MNKWSGSDQNDPNLFGIISIAHNHIFMKKEIF